MNIGVTYPIHGHYIGSLHRESRYHVVSWFNTFTTHRPVSCYQIHTFPSCETSKQSNLSHVTKSEINLPVRNSRFSIHPCSAQGLISSVFVISDISDRSPRKLVVFIMKIHMSRIEVTHKYLISFENKITGVARTSVLVLCECQVQACRRR